MLLQLDPVEAKDKLIDCWNELRNEYAARNSLVDECERLYFLDHHHGKLAKDGEKFITINDPMNVVDLGVGILTASDPRFIAYKLKETQASTVAATDVEKFLRGCFYINSQRQEASIYNQTSFNQLTHGAAVIRTLWDMDVELTEGVDEMGVPELAYEELPILIDMIPWKNVYARRGGRRPPYQYIIYADQRYVADIEGEWGVEVPNHDGDKAKQKVDYLEYWGWTLGQADGKRKWLVENAVMAGQEWVMEPRVMEGYDDLPFTVISGKPTTSDKPERQHVSILYAIKNDVYDAEEQLTHLRRITTIYTALPFLFKGDANKELPPLDAALGQVVRVDGDEDFGPVKWPGAPPDLYKQLAHSQQKIQEGSFPSVAFGQGTQGAASGYAVSLLSESGRTRLQQYQHAQERGYEVVARKILSLARNFAPNVKLTVYARYQNQPETLTVAGADMDGFRVDVTMKPKFPNDEMRQVNEAVQLSNPNLKLPSKWVQEHILQIDNPDEVERRFLVETAMQDETLKRAAVMAALKEYGIEPPPPEPAPQTPPQPQGMPQGPMQGPPADIANQVQQQAMAGLPPQMPAPEGLPPAAVMPPEMMGMMPPQAMGNGLPGERMLPPGALEALRGLIR
jgi:hypothetical protein